MKNAWDDFTDFYACRSCASPFRSEPASSVRVVLVTLMPLPRKLTWISSASKSKFNLGSSEPVLPTQYIVLMYTDICSLRKVYGNLSILLEPNVFCDQLHGTYHTDPTPTCTVDLSPSDTFLKFVTGIDTPKHLCTEANGNFVDGKCTLNVARFGDATLDAKQAACLSVGAQWDGGSCNLLH